jgi:NAD(P)-dependent dehydrogenase (short-subunit alcohol dehydrogenase family)
MTGGTSKGKLAFITGAGSGIGFEVALAFARDGAAIIATDVVQAGLDRLRPEVEKLGVPFRDALLDVCDEKAFESLAALLAAEGQVPDIVVNNAGIGYMNPFLQTTPEQWRRTLDINVLGVAWGSRVFVRLWQERGIAGHLVNIASAASVTPMPNMAAYAASKYAVEGLCEVLQMELAETPIGVSCVHPGVINTAIVTHDERSDLPREQVQRLQRHYREKGAHPSVVANAIVNGVKSGKLNIYTGPGTGLPPILKRLLPRNVFRRLLLKAAHDSGYL